MRDKCWRREESTGSSMWQSGFAMRTVAFAHLINWEWHLTFPLLLYHVFIFLYFYIMLYTSIKVTHQIKWLCCLYQHAKVTWLQIKGSSDTAGCWQSICWQRFCMSSVTTYDPFHWAPLLSFKVINSVCGGKKSEIMCLFKSLAAVFVFACLLQYAAHSVHAFMHGLL